MRKEVGRISLEDGRDVIVEMEVQKKIVVEKYLLRAVVKGKVYVKIGDREREFYEKVDSKTVSKENIVDVSVADINEIADKIEEDIKAIAIDLYVLLKLAKKWGWEISF